jgi:hypothetical protein
MKLNRCQFCEANQESEGPTCTRWQRITVIEGTLFLLIDRVPVIMGSGFSRLITGTICMIGRGMIGGEYLCKWKGMFLEDFLLC